MTLDYYILPCLFLVTYCCDPSIYTHLLPQLILMWIGSQRRITVRQPIASPPGYQSPTPGDSVPAPGSQGNSNAYQLDRKALTTTVNIPRLFIAAISLPRTHREDDDVHSVSQWWGHRGLHQDEVRENRDVRRPRKVSDSDRFRQLTTVPSRSTSRANPVSCKDEEDFDVASRPSTARVPAAIEGHSPWDARNDLSSSDTLIPAEDLIDDHYILTTKSPLPTDLSYARYISNQSVSRDPFPEEKNSSEAPTLFDETPGKFLPCPRPDPQPPPLKFNFCQRTISRLRPMSSTTPSAGEENIRNKPRHTNNSTSRELVTPLATKKKGKGVSITEEADPEAVSPSNGSPMPATGPVLTGPHLSDKISPEEAPSLPAASQSAKRMPAANRSASAQPAAPRSASTQPAAPRSASNPKPTKPNKMARKPSSASATQPTASNATAPSTNADDETQASSSSHNEDEDDHGKHLTEEEYSPAFHSVFWDIEAAKNIPIWVEPITESTNRMFGAFDPSVDGPSTLRSNRWSITGTVEV